MQFVVMLDLLVSFNMSRVGFHQVKVYDYIQGPSALNHSAVKSS